MSNPLLPTGSQPKKEKGSSGGTKELDEKQTDVLTRKK